jgi:hypothetical protein
LSKGRREKIAASLQQGVTKEKILNEIREDAMNEIDQDSKRHHRIGHKAMLHGAIFLATCNAILLLRDVKLPNTSLHYTPLMFSQHIENSSQISLINISQE